MLGIVASSRRRGVAALSTPTLTNSSALGAAPLVLSWSGTDTLGLYGQLQIATDSGFSSITQNIVFFVDGNSLARLNEAIGLITPAGTYYARIRTARDNDSGATTVTGFDPAGNAISFTADVSLWSTTFTDTINVATTALYNAPNTVNQSQYIATSGTPVLHAVGTNGVGASMNVRANAAKTGLKQFDVKYSSISNSIFLGVEDTTTDLHAFTCPGKDNSLGIVMHVYTGGADIFRGGSAVQTPTFSNAVNDIYSCVFDTSAGTVAFFRNGTSQIGTTLTGVSLSAWNAFVGAFSDDQMDVNFGQTALQNTGTGAAMYG